MDSLFIGTKSEMTDPVFLEIVKDCVENQTYKGTGWPDNFTATQNRRYRAATDEGFWGGYAYLDNEPYEKGCDYTGFIRLSSPQGSGKWSFEVKGDEVAVYYA